MRKTTKIWLIVAASLLVVGLIMLVSVILAYKSDLKNINSSEYETNIHVIEDEFDNLSVYTDTADIVFALSDDGKCKVECYEEKNAKHSVAVSGTSLVINVVDERNVYDFIDFDFSSPKITVYLPENEYASLSINEDTGDITMPKDFKFETVSIALSTGDVDFRASASGAIKIKTSTGSVRVSGIASDTLGLTVSTGKVTVNDVTCDNDVKISVSTGKAFLSDIECKNFESVGSTGDINLRKVTASQNFKITRSTGDVEFDGCDANEVYIKTGTGDVEGDFLTDKTFVVTTNTGDVEVPRTSNGGRCEIITSTGDIEIEISK